MQLSITDQLKAVFNRKGFYNDLLVEKRKTNIILKIYMMG